MFTTTIGSLFEEILTVLKFSNISLNIQTNKKIKSLIKNTLRALFAWSNLFNNESDKKSWSQKLKINTVDGLNFVGYQFLWFLWRAHSTNFSTQEMVIFCMNYERKYYGHEFWTPGMCHFCSIHENWYPRKPSTVYVFLKWPTQGNTYWVSFWRCLVHTRRCRHSSPSHDPPCPPWIPRCHRNRRVPSHPAGVHLVGEGLGWRRVMGKIHVEYKNS